MPSFFDHEFDKLSNHGGVDATLQIQPYKAAGNGNCGFRRRITAWSRAHPLGRSVRLHQTGKDGMRTFCLRLKGLPLTAELALATLNGLI